MRECAISFVDGYVLASVLVIPRKIGNSPPNKKDGSLKNRWEQNSGETP
jgi:hypothetical protein